MRCAPVATLRPVRWWRSTRGGAIAVALRARVDAPTRGGAPPVVVLSQWRCAPVATLRPVVALHP